MYKDDDTMTTMFQVMRKGVMHEAMIDECDSDLLDKHKWYVHFRRGAVNGLYRNILHDEDKTQQTRMHRVIMERVLDRILEPHEFVDHKDLNTMNNTRTNLRLATRQQNGANRLAQSVNRLGIKGVRKLPRGGYNARITVNQDCRNLGTFPTLEQAEAAYIEAAKTLHGEFARWKRGV